MPAPADSAPALPRHTPIEARVATGFSCRRRNGSYVDIPEGPCEIELGVHFAAICWESPRGRNRAEVSLGDCIDFLNEGWIVVDIIE